MRLPTVDRTTAIRMALSALAAVLMFLSAPDWNAWPLMWFGMVPEIYVALEASTSKRAFLYGWLTGPIANTAAFGWMLGFLKHFGHMSSLQAVPIMLLLTAYQGLEFALLSWGIYRVRRRVGAAWPMAVVAPVVMVVIELCTPQIFPFYLAITQAWVPPVIQIADVTGPLGVTFRSGGGRAGRDGCHRAVHAADLSFLPRHHPGLGAAGDPDRRRHRAAGRHLQIGRWSRRS